MLLFADALTGTVAEVSASLQQLHNVLQSTTAAADTSTTVELAQRATPHFAAAADSRTWDPPCQRRSSQASCIQKVATVTDRKQDASRHSEREQVTSPATRQEYSQLSSYHPQAKVSESAMSCGSCTQANEPPTHDASRTSTYAIESSQRVQAARSPSSMTRTWRSLQSEEELLACQPPAGTWALHPSPGCVAGRCCQECHADSTPECVTQTSTRHQRRQSQPGRQSTPLTGNVIRIPSSLSTSQKATKDLKLGRRAPTYAKTTAAAVARQRQAASPVRHAQPRTSCASFRCSPKAVRKFECTQCSAGDRLSR
jgi:hypothetical protein